MKRRRAWIFCALLLALFTFAEVTRPSRSEAFCDIICRIMREGILRTDVGLDILDNVVRTIELVKTLPNIYRNLDLQGMLGEFALFQDLDELLDAAQNEEIFAGNGEEPGSYWHTPGAATAGTKLVKELQETNRDLETTSEASVISRDMKVLEAVEKDYEKADVPKEMVGQPKSGMPHASGLAGEYAVAGSESSPWNARYTTLRYVEDVRAEQLGIISGLVAFATDEDTDENGRGKGMGSAGRASEATRIRPKQISDFGSGDGAAYKAIAANYSLAVDLGVQKSEITARNQMLSGVFVRLAEIVAITATADYAEWVGEGVQSWLELADGTN